MVDQARPNGVDDFDVRVGALAGDPERRLVAQDGEECATAWRADARGVNFNHDAVRQANGLG